MVNDNILKCKNVGKVLALLCILCFSKSWGQINIPNTTPVTENFDAMGVSGTAALPANWKISVAGAAAPTWAAGGNFTAVNFQASGGAPGTGGRYNWGTTPAIDRALGVMTSGSYASPNSIMAFYQNTNVGNLTQLTVSYDAERYRINTAAASIQFFYSLDGTTWVAVTAGDIAAASFPTGASAYTFGTPLVISVTSFNITGLNIVTNGNIYLRWNLNTTGSNSQGIGIDNVSVTAAYTAPCTAPTTTISPTSQTVCANVSTAITVTSSATSPTYQWQMSASAGGPFVNVANGTPTGVTYTSGTTSATLSAIGTGSAQYFYQCLVTNGSTCTATSNTVSLTIHAGPAITTQPVSVSTTSTGTASYTVAASGSGLTYQWQQSSGGAFSNISNGGSNPTYAGATGSVMTISNPPLSMSGYSYQCIVSNACGTVTTNGNSTLTVVVASASVCPVMTGAFINACQGSCAEGDNEILFFNSGTYSISVAPANIIVTYGTVSSPTITYTDGFTTNAGQTANLNSLASVGCSNLFVDASVAGVIPSNSVFMIVRSTCCFNFDFSSYCGAGTIYILYSTDASWTTGGNFTNGGTAGQLRYFRTDFSGVGGGCVTDYTYEPFLLSGGADGDAISFPPGGGAANAYFNNGCTPPALVLPIELLDFYGTQNGSSNNLVWKVASEKNVSQYIIDKSSDGINFNEMVRLNAYSREGSLSVYSCEDENPFQGITYYRLSTLEYNNQINHYKIIDIDSGSKEWNPFVYQANENLILEFKNAVPKDAELQLFDLTGKLIFESVVNKNLTKIPTQTFAEGIYFMRITTPYKTENFKLVIQK